MLGWRIPRRTSFLRGMALRPDFHLQKQLAKERGVRANQRQPPSARSAKMSRHLKQGEPPSRPSRMEDDSPPNP